MTCDVATPAVADGFDATMTDDTHDPEEVALARAAAALWGACLNADENWSGGIGHSAHAAMVGVVMEMTSRDYIDHECFPHALTLDGRRYVATPSPTSTSYASASLIVNDAETGERISYYPGQ